MRKVLHSGSLLAVFFFLLGLGTVLIGKLIAPELEMVVAENQPLYQGCTGQKIVALTFNVDWGEEFLPEILKTLQKKNALATFMITGKWAQKNPALVRQIAQAGHEIGNHSSHHPHPNNLGRSELEEELNRTRRVIEEISGKTPQVFAPPYGEFNQRVLNVAEDLGYTVIMWTLDTVDWKRPAASVIVDRVIRGIQPDYIILMHPTAPTLQALPEILGYLQQEGYTLMTVSGMIQEGGKSNR